MIDVLLFFVIFLFGCFYALLLNELERWAHIVTQATWLTVVVGVAGTLGLAGLFTLFSEFTYWRVWAAFGLSGAPVVLRSLLRQWLHEKAQRDEVIRNATP